MTATAGQELLERMAPCCHRTARLSTQGLVGARAPTGLGKVAGGLIEDDRAPAELACLQVIDGLVPDGSGG